MIKLRRMDNGWNFRVGRKAPYSPIVYIQYFNKASGEWGRFIRGNIGRFYFDRTL